MSDRVKVVEFTVAGPLPAWLRDAKPGVAFDVPGIGGCRFLSVAPDPFGGSGFVVRVAEGLRPLSAH